MATGIFSAMLLSNIFKSQEIKYFDNKWQRIVFLSLLRCSDQTLNLLPLTVLPGWMYLNFVLCGLINLKSDIVKYRELWSKLSPRKINAKNENCCLRRAYKKLRKREVKGKGEKERCIHLNAKFQRIARRDKNSLPQWSMQRNRGKQ